VDFPGSVFDAGHAYIIHTLQEFVTQPHPRAIGNLPPSRLPLVHRQTLESSRIRCSQDRWRLRYLRIKVYDALAIATQVGAEAPRRTDLARPPA
jgi:hypothetical protein